MNICRINTKERIRSFSFLRIFCIVFCLLFLIGCTGYYPGMNKLDSLTFSANLKADANASYGKKAASYDGRIYYLSAESGTPGIHSMTSQGEDVRLEIPVEDIRAINIREGDIYYSGFTGIEENAAGPFRQFRLLFRKAGETDIVDFLKEAEYSDDLRDENIWDFYFSKTGIMVLRLVDIVGYEGHSDLSVVCFQNEEAIPLSNYQRPIIYRKAESGIANQALLSIAQMDELYIDLGNAIYDNPERTERLFGWGSIGVYDSNQQLIALPIDRMFSYYGIYMNSSFPRWFCRVDVERMIFAFAHGIERYDQKTDSMSDVVAFTSPESIFNQIDCGDSILVFTQRLRKNEWWDYIAFNTLKLNRALGESLYRVNPETGEKSCS